MLFRIASATSINLQGGTGSVTTGVLAAGASSTKQYISPIQNPAIPSNDDWPSEAVSLVLNITTAGASCYAKARLARASAAGALLEATGYSPEVLVDTTGAKTLSIPSFNWAAGSYDDRIALEVIIRNGSTGTRTVVYTYSLQACYFNYSTLIGKKVLLGTGIGDTVTTAGLVNTSTSQNYTLTADWDGIKCGVNNVSLVLRRNYVLFAEKPGDPFKVKSDGITTFYKSLHMLCATMEVLITFREVIVAKTYRMVVSVVTFATVWQNANLILTRNSTLTAQVTSFLVTGRDASLSVKRNFKLTADRRTYALTGISLLFILLRNYKLIADRAIFTFLGKAASFLKALRLTATTRAYTLTGIAVTFRKALRLIADSRSYTIIAWASSLIFLRNFTLTAVNALYSILGKQADLILVRNFRMIATNASYVVSGIVAGLSLLRNFRLFATTVTYVINSVSTSHYRLIATGAQYLIATTNTIFRKALRISSDLGILIVTMRPASFRKALRMIATKRSYVVTGISIWRGHIKRICGVAWLNVKKFCGVNHDNIRKANKVDA